MTAKLLFSSLSISFMAGLDPTLHSYWLSTSRGGIFKLMWAQESILRNRFCQPMYSLAIRYDNLIPIRFLAPIDCSKISAQL